MTVTLNGSKWAGTIELNAPIETIWGIADQLMELGFTSIEQSSDTVFLIIGDAIVNLTPSDEFKES